MISRFIDFLRLLGATPSNHATLLAEALQANGLHVWYDDFSLRLGDSLRQSIDRGLARSRFGVVILSGRFFEKHWAPQELNGLATREVNGQKVMLPVWHGVGFSEVRNYSPMLADRIAVQTKDGLVPHGYGINELEVCEPSATHNEIRTKECQQNVTTSEHDRPHS